MCGRFVLFRPESDLREELAGLPEIKEVIMPEGAPPPRYNLAPSMTVAAVDLSRPGVAQLSPARWGLIPEWKKEESAPVLFNARAETLAQKPSFRESFEFRRCLVPMDGYYEWKDKQPHFISRASGHLLWAAGLYSQALAKLSVTIVTTDSTPPIDWLHHRMPRFLHEEEMSLWCRGEPENAMTLLKPTPPNLLDDIRTWPVSRAVGAASNDYPELITRKSV